MSIEASAENPFSDRYIDLLEERLGGKALGCSDEWFAPCANLVKASAPIFKPGHFVDTGQWMDGWESRRSFGRRERALAKRDYDWCVLRLGVAGTVAGIDIDTAHFRGNAPQTASLEACDYNGTPDDETIWTEILAPVPLAADSHNFFTIDNAKPCTHLRLKIFPDGGVARLRVYGTARIEPAHFVAGELLDLASVLHGGRGIACSDAFYSSPNNLLRPQRGENMGDGWETRRRRDQHNDWCIIRLGLAGSIRKVIVDTAHFKGNYPDSFTLQACYSESDDVSGADTLWQTVLPRLPLHADQEHRYISEIESLENACYSHVRLNIYPDGGVSRLRVLGFPDWNLLAEHGA